MSNPTQGKPYTAQVGDTLSRIAAMAYGDPGKVSLISNANQATLKTGPDQIQPGTVINIPVDPTREKLKTEAAAQRLTSQPSDKMTLILGDREVPIESGSVIRTMDTCADMWLANIAYINGEDPALDALVKPYSYAKASVYLGSQLMVNGLLYVVSPSLDAKSTLAMTGFSYTADAIDSTIKPPYEARNVTLEQRTSDLAATIGISVEVDGDTGGIFDRVTAEEGDSIFSHLQPLAAQRGMLLSSTPQGDFHLLRAKTSGSVVATLEEGQPTVTSWGATFDGRKRFNTYRAVGQSPGSNAKASVAIDKEVPRSRFLTITADETTEGNICNAAQWRRSKQLAEALSIPLPVSSWYDPSGNLWRENTLVTVISKTLFLPKGFTFLIKSVEYQYGAGGTPAVLNLVPPSVYSLEEIRDPWA